MSVLIILVALFLGISCGIISGLTPGIHINTLSLVMLANVGILSKYFSMLSLAVFLMSMSITHSFLDSIPSIFLGAPDPDSGLAVLPAHELLMNGQGMRALHLMTLGGLGTSMICLLALPLLFLILNPMQPYLKIAVPYVLIGSTIWFILKEKGLQKRIIAISIVLLSGVLGLVVLNHINVKEPLFPIFSGLFGVSGLLLSMSETNYIPKQNFKVSIPFLANIKNYIKAAVSSLIVSLMPAIGAAQAAGIAQAGTKFSKKEDYLVIVGGINNAGVIFTLAALFLIGKGRSGVMVVMNQIISLDFRAFLILVLAIIATTGIAILLTLKLGKVFAVAIPKINYKLLSTLIIIFIIVLVLYFCGWLGLLILSISCALGMLAPVIGVRRVHAMAVLTLPVLFWLL